MCPVVIVHRAIKAITSVHVNICDCNDVTVLFVCCSVVGARWSSGRASEFRSRGPGFKTTCDRASNFSVEGTGVQNNLCPFESWITSFTLLCLCFSEVTVKAVGLFYLVFMPGEVRSHTGKWKNLLWTHRAGDLILCTTIAVNILTYGLCQLTK